MHYYVSGDIFVEVLRRDTDSVEYEMCHLNTSQLSTIVDVPPDYQTVEEEDNELPSYDEALLEHMESGVHSSLLNIDTNGVNTSHYVDR